MKKSLALTTVLALFAAACGDDDGGNTTPDAANDPDGSTPDMMVEEGEKAVVVSGDFSATGIMSVLDVEAETVETNVAPATSVGTDPFLRKIGDELFVTNRSTGNSVTILKASDYSLVEMVGLGAGTNPYDVAVVGNKVYVATYAAKGLKVFTRGSSTVTDIDLSTDDPDGKPNCASIVAVGTKVYVSCQLLNDEMGFAPRADSRVYVVDTATDTKTGTITLETVNPFSLLQALPNGDLVVGTYVYPSGAGCIERITTSGTPSSACVIDNEDLGGNATRFDVTSTKLYVRTSDDVGVGTIRSFALADLTTPTTVSGATDSIGDFTVCPSGAIVATEQPGYTAPTNSPKGLRIYSATGTQLTTAPLDFGLAPASQFGLVCY